MSGEAALPEPTDDPHCRSCGYRSEDPPWGPDGEQPTFELCPCCGVQAGYEDATVAATHRYRQRWLQRGAPWVMAEVPVDGLTTEERLTHVPAEFA